MRNSCWCGVEMQERKAGNWETWTGWQSPFQGMCVGVVWTVDCGLWNLQRALGFKVSSRTIGLPVNFAKIGGMGFCSLEGISIILSVGLTAWILDAGPQQYEDEWVKMVGPDEHHHE